MDGNFWSHWIPRKTHRVTHTKRNISFITFSIQTMQQRQKSSLSSSPQLLLDHWCVIFTHADNRTRMALRLCCRSFRTRFDSLRTSWTVHYAVITGLTYLAPLSSSVPGRGPVYVPEQRHYSLAQNAQHAVELANAWKQKPFGKPTLWGLPRGEFQTTQNAFQADAYAPFQIDPSTSISLSICKLVECVSSAREYDITGSVSVGVLRARTEGCTLAEMSKLIRMELISSASKERNM